MSKPLLRRIANRTATLIAKGLLPDSDRSVDFIAARMNVQMCMLPVKIQSLVYRKTFNLVAIKVDRIVGGAKRSKTRKALLATVVG